MKTLATIAIAVGLMAATATGVRAAPCTDGYIGCLNDTHDWWGPAQTFADIVCLDDYLTCVSRQILIS